MALPNCVPDIAYHSYTRVHSYLDIRRQFPAIAPITPTEQSCKVTLTRSQNFLKTYHQYRSRCACTNEECITATAPSHLLSSRHYAIRAREASLAAQTLGITTRHSIAMPTSIWICSKMPKPSSRDSTVLKKWVEPWVEGGWTSDLSYLFLSIVAQYS